MKKVLRNLIVCMLCLSVLLACASCSNKVERFIEKIEEEESCKINMTISMEVPGYDEPYKITMLMKLDGNLEYYEDSLGDCYYTETIDQTEYTYTKDENGKWIKTEAPVEDDSSTDSDYDELWNLDNYEKVKGEKNTYRQKENCEINGFDDLELYVDKDTCTIKGEMIVEGVSCDFKMVISQVGEVELTLPKVG